MHNYKEIVALFHVVHVQDDQAIKNDQIFAPSGTGEHAWAIIYASTGKEDQSISYTQERQCFHKR